MWNISYKRWNLSPKRKWIRFCGLCKIVKINRLDDWWIIEWRIINWKYDIRRKKKVSIVFKLINGGRYQEGKTKILT